MNFSAIVKQKGDRMSSHVNVGNRLSGVFRPAARLLLGSSAFLLSQAAWAKPSFTPPGWLKHPEHHIPAVPEVNAWWVLVPITIVIMLVSSLQIYRDRAPQKQ
jgi:hypothetical protein